MSESNDSNPMLTLEQRIYLVLGYDPNQSSTFRFAADFSKVQSLIQLANVLARVVRFVAKRNNLWRAYAVIDLLADEMNREVSR